MRYDATSRRDEIARRAFCHDPHFQIATADVRVMADQLIEKFPGNPSTGAVAMISPTPTRPHCSPRGPTAAY
jgi:hypothetical protein